MKKFVLLALLAVPAFPQRIIRTIAGADPVLRGEGEVARNVTLGRIRDVAIDRNRTVYFTDADFGVVARLGAGWTFQVVAGTGRKGFAGDGGPARQALLFEPAGLTFDGSGNLYVGDNETQPGAPRRGRVRRISPDGRIQTVAGGGNDRTGEDIAATDAYLDFIGGLAADTQGNVFFAETGAGRVRRLSADGRIRTIAGNGRSGLFGPPDQTSNGDGGPATAASITPADVAIAPNGSILVADIQSARIVQVSNDGILSTVAGGRSGPPVAGDPATIFDLSQPTGITVAPDGTIYVFGEYGVFAIAPDKRIRQISGDIVDRFIDGGPAVRSSFRNTWYDLNGLALDANGNLYVADTGNYRLRRIDTTGTVHTFAGTGLYRREGENWPATVAYLNAPTRIARGPAGQIYFIDRESCRAREIGSNGLIRTVAGDGTCLTVTAADGTPDGIAATSMGMGGLQSIAVDREGNLLIANGSQIYRIALDGRLSVVVNRLGRPGPPPAEGVRAIDAQIFSSISGLNVDGAGNLYFTEGFMNRVRRVSPDGILTTIAGPTADGPGSGGFAGDGGLALEARFNGLGDIVSDPLGNLYIADFGNGRIRKITADGRVSTIAGTGTRGEPQAGARAIESPIRMDPFSQLAVDDAGTVFFTSSGMNRVWRIGTDGILRIEAGTGDPAFRGDGSAAEAAALSGPMGVAVAPNGSVWISDTGNHRIREVTGR